MAMKVTIKCHHIFSHASSTATFDFFFFSKKKKLSSKIALIWGIIQHFTSVYKKYIYTFNVTEFVSMAKYKRALLYKYFCIFLRTIYPNENLNYFQLK